MEKRSAVLVEARMKPAEYERNDWVANVEFGHTIEDVLDPGYWAFTAPKLKPYDHIEARSEDGTWVADLIVCGCDRTWAKVALKQKFNLTTQDVSQSQASKHTVEWKGPQLRFGVVRTSDATIVKDGFREKAQAEAWMKEHEQTT